MDDDFNMSLRKFLKQVGVTSQQAIEEAVRKAGTGASGKTLTARATICIPEIGLTHEVSGSIEGPAK